MSKFITNLSIDVQAVLEMLPPGTSIQEVRLTESKRAVEILWENDNLLTPYTVPIPFPLENLSGDLPKNVQRKDAPKVATNEPVATLATETQKSTVDKGRRKR